MKRIIPLIIILMLLFSACSHSGSGAIKEVNENTNLPFSLTLKEKDLEYGDEYKKEPGFGGYTLNKDGLLIWAAGWPDVLDDYHITEYRITNHEYNVFNISVGSALNEAVSVLENKGYIRDSKEESSFGGDRVFKKSEKVKIKLSFDESGNVYEIWVTAVVTNKENVVF